MAGGAPYPRASSMSSNTLLPPPRSSSFLLLALFALLLLPASLGFVLAPNYFPGKSIPASKSICMQLFGGNAPFGDAITSFGRNFLGDRQGEVFLPPESFKLSSARGQLSAASWSSIAGRSEGKAKVNQDSALALVPLQEGINMYSVFDGHGPSGHVIAAFLSENFPRSMQDALLRSQGSQLPEWVKFAFSQMDFDASEAIGTAALSQSGATATVILHNSDSLLVASVGDSRAVLAALDGTSVALTTDHNPADPAERGRIEASGGMVSVFPGEPSVEACGKGRVFLQGQSYPGLATSRAFGDYLAKQAGVIAEPDLKCVKIGKNKVLILATDGVWDVLDEQTAISTCLQFYKDRDAAAAAQVLVDASRMIWEGRPGSEATIDDISAVVTFF